MAFEFGSPSGDRNPLWVVDREKRNRLPFPARAVLPRFAGISGGKTGPMHIDLVGHLTATFDGGKVSVRAKINLYPVDPV